MIEYKICIPTYQRYDMVKEKTLNFLESQNIPKDKIHLWVATQEEYDRYSESLKGTGYTNLHIGVVGLSQQRNYVEQQCHPEGTYIVWMDDDLESIKKKTGDNSMDVVDDFYTEVIETGFNEMTRVGSHIWGIYGASNPYFMKDKFTHKLCYMVGSMFGVITQKSDDLLRVTEHGEDYEYSIRQYVKNGVVCRFDYITPITKYFGKGGLEEHRKDESVVYNGIRTIKKLYPKYCEIYFRKDGTPELRLKDKTR